MADAITDHLLNQVVAIAGNNGENSVGGVLIQANPQYASTVTNRLAPYQNFPRTMRPALEGVADYVRGEMIPRTFDQEGPGWRRLARRTQMERAAQGYNPLHPILRRSGDLFKELTERGHPGHVEIIKTGKNARVVVGGSSEKFVRNQGGNWMLHIPPRPMIPGTGGLSLSGRDKQQIVDIMRTGIQQAINRRGK